MSRGSGVLGRRDVKQGQNKSTAVVHEPIGQYAINHCAMRDAAFAAGITQEHFQELVVARVGRIVSDLINGTTSDPHPVAAVEVTAKAVANNVLARGAEKLAADMGTTVDDLTEAAAYDHISYC